MNRLRYGALTLTLLLLGGLGQVVIAATRHTVEVRLAPDSGAIEIDDTLQLGSRDSFRFYLAPWLEIDSLSLDGKPISPETVGDQRFVRLPDRDTHLLRFALRGRVPARAGAATGSIASGGADGVYLPAFAGWLPWDGVEPVEYRLQVDLPPAQRAAASGRLVDETLGVDGNRAVFESERAGEPPSLFVGPYRVDELQRGKLRLRTYIHAELEGLSQAYLESAATYIERYEQRIGAYPYADFHIVSAPIPVGLGFPNLTYIGRRVLPLPFMRGRSLAHEVLHNWWGNAVAVDYASGNWAEGLTTFMADYALEMDKSVDAARAMRVKWLRDYAALPDALDRPVRAFRSKHHQASQIIGYNKVAFIFHMLGIEIGQRALNDGLRRFWQHHRYGSAGWADLQAAFEHASGRRLAWFFNQWLDRVGAPRPTLGAHSVDALDTGYRTQIEILQPEPGYRLKLPVTLGIGAGERRRQIEVAGTRTEVEWITAERPRFVHLDPESDLFRLLEPDETTPIIRDVTLDPDAVVAVDSGGDEFAVIARDLASRLMDTSPRFESVPLTPDLTRPLMLITTPQNIGARLRQLGLTAPGLPEIEAQAIAWTARLANGTPLLVISADDAAALEALLRPLPHYGGQSYVMFNRGRAAARGIWALNRGALYREL